MSDLELLEKIKLLPLDYQQEVNNFVDFILEKKINIPYPEHKNRESGQLKGKVWMSPDFDAPLEDFKDYM